MLQKDTTRIVSLTCLLWLCADLVQNRFQLCLEAAERLCAFDQFGLGLTVERVGHQETRRAIDIGGLSICSVLLDPVKIFTAVVTAVECGGIQANGVRDGFQAPVREGADILAKGIGKEMRMHLPEPVLIPGAISCQRRIAGFCFGSRPFGASNIIADEIAHRTIDELDLTSVNIILSEQGFGFLMEPRAEWTLKIGKFLDPDRRARIAHGIIVRLKVRSRLYGHNFCNRSNVGPDNSKNDQ